MRGAGARSVRLPAAHETPSVGLLDLADHAVTETDQRGRRGAFLRVFLEATLFSLKEPTRAHRHLCLFLTRLSTRPVALKNPRSEKGEKCLIPEICSYVKKKVLRWWAFHSLFKP